MNRPLLGVAPHAARALRDHTIRAGRARRIPGFAVAALTLVSSACNAPREVVELRAPAELATSSVLAAPSLPWTLFDRRSASLVAGDGWSQTQRDATAGGVDRYSLIALGDASALHLIWPGGAELDLYLRCRPVQSDPAATRTRIRVASQASPVADAELLPGWNDLRFPMAGTTAPGSLLDVELRFGAGQPEGMGSPSDRARRTQWAYCSAAALLPRDPRPPLQMLAELHDLDLDDDDLDSSEPSPRVQEIGVPVPGGSLAEIDLSETRLPADCPLSVRLVGGSLPGPVDVSLPDPAGRRVRVRNPSVAPVEARIDLGPSGRAECSIPADGGPLGEITLRERTNRSDSPRRPHVFVYLVDTLRADALEKAYRGLMAAPRMAAFSRDAVRFDNAWASSSWTLPSILSLVTGVHPHRNAIWRLDQALPRSGARTLGEILTAEGYATVGLSQTWIAGPIYGFDRGFGDFFVSEQINGMELRTNDLLTLMRAWLMGRWNGQQPVFAYLHSVEPHAPYAPRADDIARFGGVRLASRVAAPLQIQTLRDLGKGLSDDEMSDVLALYHSEVAYADQSFGRFLDILRGTGLYDDSIVILLSDHGEEFREHGGFGHGRNLYEESTRVPLVVKFPHGRWGGRRIDSGVSLTDLVPTLLDQLEIAHDPSLTLDGESLLPLLSSVERSRRIQISEVVTKREGPESEAKLYRSLQISGARCIHVTPFEPRPGAEERWIFLRRDPESRSEVALQEESGAARVCRDALTRFEASVKSGRGPTSTFRLTDDQLESLRSLGYL